MSLFLNKGSQSLAAFWCVLVVGSSDHGHFSGMALGESQVLLWCYFLAVTTLHLNRSSLSLTGTGSAPQHQP
jgi:hypothetical protein